MPHEEMEKEGFFNNYLENVADWQQLIGTFNMNSRSVWLNSHRNHLFVFFILSSEIKTEQQVLPIFKQTFSVVSLEELNWASLIFYPSCIYT